MQFLIDGPQLLTHLGLTNQPIAAQLAEVQQRLHAWAGNRKKRRVTAVFDSVPRQAQPERIPTSDVKLQFAPEGKTAVFLLQNRLEKAKSSPEQTLVTNNPQLIREANQRNVPTMRIEKFAMRLGQLSPEDQVWNEAAAPIVGSDVSDEEIAQWLNPLDGEEELIDEETAVSAQDAYADELNLSEDELAEWLNMFKRDG